jgi:predicted nucleic acid-binding protein
MIYFDTSVLIAAVRSDEPGHLESLVSVKKGGCTSPHAMLEAFSILTGGQGGRRFSPAFAAKTLAVSFEKHLQSVSLNWREIHSILAEAHARGIRGGAIYDYQHLACARKAGADVLLTFNVRDFEAFVRNGDPSIQSPS